MGKQLPNKADKAVRYAMPFPGHVSPSPAVSPFLCPAGTSSSQINETSQSLHHSFSSTCIYLGLHMWKYNSVVYKGSVCCRELLYTCTGFQLQLYYRTANSAIRSNMLLGRQTDFHGNSLKFTHPRLRASTTNSQRNGRRKQMKRKLRRK